MHKVYFHKELPELIVYLFNERVICDISMDLDLLPDRLDGKPYDFTDLLYNNSLYDGYNLNKDEYEKIVKRMKSRYHNEFMPTERDKNPEFETLDFCSEMLPGKTIIDGICIDHRNGDSIEVWPRTLYSGEK